MGATPVTVYPNIISKNTNDLPDESSYRINGPKALRSVCGGAGEEDILPYDSSITTQNEGMAVKALRQLAPPLPSREFCPEPDMVPHECGLCRKRFECKTELYNHELCHLMKRPHSCRTCGNLFRTKNELRGHSKSHQEIYSCDSCKVSYRRPSSLANHMKKHSYPPPNSKTPLGTLRFNNNNNMVPPFGTLKINRKYHSIPHAPNNYQKDVLSGDQVHTDPFRINQILHMPDKMYNDKSCIVKVPPPRRSMKICVAKGKRSVRFKGSKSKATEGRRRPHVCRYCDKAFPHRTTLTSHMKLHESNMYREKFTEPAEPRDQRLGCLAKPPVLANIQTLLCKEGPVPKSSRHIISPSLSKGNYFCEYCRKRFNTDQKLYRHMWIHRKKFHACSSCGNTFTNLSLLDSHIRAQHPGENAFKCKTCGQKFSSRQALCTHERGAHGTSMFWCQICEKMFTSHSGYVIHGRIHSGERPYDCRYCDKAFRDMGTLRKHERIHTGKQPYACPLCHRAFNKKVALREHLRWVHIINGKSETGAFCCQLCQKMSLDHEELCAHLVQHVDKIATIAKGVVKKRPAAKPSPTAASTAKSKRKKKRQRKAVKKGRRVRILSDQSDTKSFNVKIRNTARFPAGQNCPHTFYPPSLSNAKNNQWDMFPYKDTVLFPVHMHICKGPQ